MYLEIRNTFEELTDAHEDIPRHHLKLVLSRLRSVAGRTVV